MSKHTEICTKNADFFVYVIFLLYLCSCKGSKSMDEYRFINIDQEPTEEQLAQLMHEVAVEAKERHDRAHAAYFAHIRQMARTIATRT